MSGQVIIVVSDLDDPKHGEITVAENPKEAAHHIETLLEAGFEQDRLRVFNGSEMSLRVVHRPVVALVSGGSSGTAAGATDNSSDHQTDIQREPEPVVLRTKNETREEVKAAPLVKNGVRFSAMFRPA